MTMPRRLGGLAVALFVVLWPNPISAQAQAPAARPLSLVEALELAERESESVGIARAELDRAQGERRQARSGYFPQLSGSASYQRTLQSQFSTFRDETGDTIAQPAPEDCPDFVPRPGLPIEERLDSLESAAQCASTVNPFGAFEDLPFGRENVYRFGLSFSQTLFSGGRLKGQTQTANASLRTAALGLTSARAQLLLDVTQAYYDATLGDRLVVIAEATLRQTDTTLGQTQLARQVGNQSEFDLLRARVTRDNQRPVVIQRRADRDLAYYRLKQLLNLPLDQPLALTTALGDSTLIPAPQLAELVDSPGDTSSEVRAPVRQAAEGVTSEQGRLRVARAQRLPQLTLSSDYAELGYPGNGSPFDASYLSDWTVSVALQLPLFTGGRIKGDVQVARANLDQARLRLQQTRELAQVESRNTGIQLEAAVAAWEASAGTEEQASRAYQIAEVRYREGISTQTELNDLRIQMSQAQANRAQAARDLQIAKVRLALLPALPLSGSGTGTGTLPSTGAGTGGQPSGGPPPPPPAPYQPPQPATSAASIFTGTTQTGVAGR